MKISSSLTKLTISLPLKKEVKGKSELPNYIWRVVPIIMALVSIVAWIFYYSQDLTLAYNDARSHLNVARRVIDNLQPGSAQIGSVWLPLYHVLELPLIWNDFLWHSGIAGSLISMVSFVLGGIVLLSFSKKLKFDVWATLVVIMSYALNPNLLFMQTTPMTEALLIFLSLTSVYYAVRWVDKFNLLELIRTAFFVFLASLTRYDGWFLFASIFTLVAYLTYKKRGYKFTEGNIILFSTLAGFGIFLWILWNFVIFGDPLYFVFGPFSAKAQQDILLAEGRLLTKGNLLYSTFIYLLAVMHNVGVWLGILAVAGMWLFVKSRRYKQKTKLAVGLLLVPLIFNIISLVVGHSVIHLPELPPYTWFNDRYGLMILPATSVALGFLANRRKIIAILISLVILTQTYSMYTQNRVITIEDGVRGASGEYLDEASGWIKENVDNDGLILVAASSNDALLFSSGLPLKRFITEGAKEYWGASLDKPSVFAKWVVMHKGDLVEKSLKDNDDFLTNYRLVYKDSFSYIYKRELELLTPLTEDELPN